MSFKKRNKQQQKKWQNKIIRKRLMEISICVDNYIYKHKPISIEEAKTYAQEISLYKTQCNGDIHILQVIDKLTRCMKNIVEETTKNLTSSLNNTDSEKEENINAESSMNTHLEDNIMTKNDKNHHEMLASKNILYKNIAPTQLVFVSCESLNETIDVNEVNGTYGNNETQTYDLNKVISKCPDLNKELENKKLETTDKSNDLNFKSSTDRIVPKIINKNVLDKDELNIKNAEKPPVKVFETPKLLLAKDHLRSSYNDILNTQKLKLDLAKRNVNAITQPLHHISAENNKENIVKNTQKTNYSVNRAKKIINKSAQVKPASEKKKCIKKSSNKENITNTTQGGKKLKIIPGNNTTNNSKIPKQFKHTSVHIRNDEVSITARDENRSDKIISHDNSLTYNKCVGNDLSWVENIRYVREVSSNECDPKLNGLEDNFWDNFSFPGGWSDILNFSTK